MRTPPAILIIDDESQSRSLISKLLKDKGISDHIYEADNVQDALTSIATNKPVIIFLDIQLKNETGFDLLDKLPANNLAIIFTTAHSEHAVKAFRYSALDYLVKPIDTDEFNRTLDKAIAHYRKDPGFQKQQIELIRQYKSGITVPTLTIPTSEGILFIKINDIIYCRAIGNYTEFHFQNKPNILSSYNLGHYQELLEDHHFFRTHRSYIVSLSHVSMYKKGEGGSVVMIDGEEIEVSRNNKEALLKSLNI